MPVKRRVAKFRRMDVTPTQWAWLTDDFEAEREGWEDFALELYAGRPDILETPGDKPTLAALWHRHGEQVLSDWAAERPGTRPTTWWRVAAPRWNGSVRAPEPRMKVGGSGLPTHEAHPECHFDADDFPSGIPRRWETRPTLERLPVFESEASYLKRHGLLQPGEMERLTKADFIPVTAEVGRGWC
jgi:hypothetical protein